MSRFYKQNSCYNGMMLSKSYICNINKISELIDCVAWGLKTGIYIKAYWWQ